MKTIELIINGQNASFTTKSVTLDGKEYFYSHMTDLHHSPIILTYSFDYDGETKRLTYQKKDSKILMAIFSQVQKMEAQKAAKAAESKQAAEPAEVAAKDTTEAKKPIRVEEIINSTDETPASESEQEKETAADNEQDETKEADADKTSEETKESKKSEVVEENKPKKTLKDLFGKKKNNEEDPSSDSESSNEDSKAEEKEPMDPEKQVKLKKSLKIFAIIIAAVLVVSIVYYFVFGTSSDPSNTNPNNTESQQYEDIDQLIEDLQ